MGIPPPTVVTPVLASGFGGTAPIQTLFQANPQDALRKVQEDAKVDKLKSSISSRTNIKFFFFSFFLKAKLQQDEMKQKILDEVEPQTLQQQENISIKGQSARQLVMQKLMRKSDVSFIFL